MSLAPPTFDVFRAVAEKSEAPEGVTALQYLCHAIRRHCGERAPPFGLRTLTTLLGARVERRPALGRLRGVLEQRGAEYVISVNSDRPWRQQRFTIAHELGHLLLLRQFADDPTAQAAVQASNNWATVEAWCDAFALELLVPFHDLYVEVYPDALHLTPQGLARLYDRYLVSHHALAKRLLDLDLDAVTLWRQDLVPNDHTWRLSGVHRTGPHYVPLRMTAHRHLRPDPFDRLLYPDDGWHLVYNDFTICLRGRNWRGRALVISPAHRAQPPTFEGFVVPDERSRPFDALILFRARRKPKTRRRHSQQGS